MKMKQTTKYYFNLADTMYDSHPWTALQEQMGFYDWMRQIVGYIPVTDDEYTRTLFQTYIWPKYYKEFIFVGDKEEFEPAFASDVCGAIFTWLEATKENYGFLIKTYNEQRNNLLKGIKSTTRSKVNDTPQAIDGDVWDDEYVSSTSGVETETDANTLINRIDEINRKIRNVYFDWAEEFREFVIW